MIYNQLFPIYGEPPMPGMTMTEKILARHAGTQRRCAGRKRLGGRRHPHDPRRLRARAPSASSTSKFGRNAKVWDKRQGRHHPRPLHFHRRPEMSPQRADPPRFRQGAGAADIITTRSSSRTNRRCPIPIAIRPRPTTRASATRPCPRKATSAPAKFCWAPIATPAPPARSANSPPASATPTPRSSWAPAKPGSRFRRR